MIYDANTEFKRLRLEAIKVSGNCNKPVKSNYQVTDPTLPRTTHELSPLASIWLAHSKWNAAK